MTFNNTFIPQSFLPSGGLKLGRLIADLNEPVVGDHHDPQATPKKVTTKKRNVQLEGDDRDDTGVWAIVRKVLALSRQEGNTSQYMLTADTATEHKLDDAGDYFSDVIALEEEVKKFIETHDDVFMVVGLKTLENVELSREREASRATAMQATVPLSVAASAGGVPPVVADALDPTFGGKAERGYSSKEEFHSVGEGIWAFGYCKIKKRRFMSHNGSGVKQGVRWKAISDPRYRTSRGAESSEMPYFEAEIDDDWGLGSGEPEDPWTSTKLDDEGNVVWMAAD